MCRLFPSAIIQSTVKQVSISVHWSVMRSDFVLMQNTQVILSLTQLFFHRQASPSVIEIHDSMTECEEDARPSLGQMEDKAFVSRLHSFMKDRGTPIERIPHLGFKQSEFISTAVE